MERIQLLTHKLKDTENQREKVKQEVLPFAFKKEVLSFSLSQHRKCSINRSVYIAGYISCYLFPQLVNLTSKKPRAVRSDVLTLESDVYDWQVKVYNSDMKLLEEQGKLEKYRMDRLKKLRTGK